MTNKQPTTRRLRISTGCLAASGEFLLGHWSLGIGHSRRGRTPVAHLFQVGVGSGGMPVLDLLCRDPRLSSVTIVEPDVYKEHNAERHLFPLSAVGKSKAVLAEQWLRERRPELQVHLLPCDLLDRERQAEI